jgi:hypothetical protein
LRGVTKVNAPAPRHRHHPDRAGAAAALIPAAAVAGIAGPPISGLRSSDVSSLNWRPRFGVAALFLLSAERR